MVKAIGENVRAKAFRFGIFRAEILGRQRAVFPLFARRNPHFGPLPAARFSIQIWGNPAVLRLAMLVCVSVL
jgi:hypothetical protein